MRHPSRRLRTVLVMALAAVVALAGEPGAEADLQGSALVKRLLKFEVSGTFESFDPQTGTVTFTFTGPFYSVAVDDATGVVGDEAGEQVGVLEGAVARFHFDPTKGLSSDGARFSCEECTMRFDDGSVLEPILDDASTPTPEPDIPMEGRLLFELGPVPGSAPGTMTVRGIGCGGAKETAGAGMFADTAGAVCINGTFTFPSPFPTDPQGWEDTVATGESDCTFVLHETVAV